MEQLPENDLEKIDATVIKSTTGYLLRAARENLGMSIEDVVAIIKLAPRQIIALEADDFKALPELAFIRGFVRSYAKVLQLDVQPLLDGLPGAVKENVETAPLDVSLSEDKISHKQNVNWLAAALIVVLLIGGFVLWQAKTAGPAVEAVVATSGVPEIIAATGSEVSAVPGSEVPAAPELASAPVAALPVTQPLAIGPSVVAAVSAPTGKTALRLVFDKESWVQITDQSGKTLISQVNQPGSELHLDGTAPFTMVIGHAAAVHLFYREQAVDMKPYINAGSDVARMTLK